jgi:uncharacterized protein YjiS (DUF1127 family)
LRGTHGAHAADALFAAGLVAYVLGHPHRQNRQATIMTALDTIPARRAASAEGAILSFLSRLAAWADARATRKALARLTERELEDIGIDPADVAGLAERLRRV